LALKGLNEDHYNIIVFFTEIDLMVVVTVNVMHSARSDSLRELNVRTNYVCINYTYGNISLC